MPEDQTKPDTWRIGKPMLIFWVGVFMFCVALSISMLVHELNPHQTEMTSGFAWTGFLLIILGLFAEWACWFSEYH